MEKYALMAAAFGALAITAASGLLIIPALRRLHFGQTIKEIGPTWHQGKNGTPAMGGLTFYLCVLVGVVLGYTVLALSVPSPVSYTHLDVYKRQIRATVVNMHTVKPLDEDAVLSVAEKCGAVVTAEEHSVIGGLGSAVAEVLAGRSGAKFARVGIEDRFGQSGTPAELFADYGLTAENIAENARRLVK